MLPNTWKGKNTVAYLSEVHSEATSIFAAESLFCKLYIIFTLVVWTHSQFGSSIMYIHIYIYILCRVYVYIFIEICHVYNIYIYNIQYIYIYNIIIIFLCIDLCTVMQRNNSARSNHGMLSWDANVGGCDLVKRDGMEVETMDMETP